MVSQNILDKFKSRIDKDSSTPIYLQIKNYLIELIDSEEIQPGEMLPTGEKLCDVLKVSRSPIRSALGELENEGYIKRIQGKGTFVSTKPYLKDAYLQSKAIGFVIPDFNTNWARELLVGIENELTKSGYSLLFGISHQQPDLEKALIKRYINYGVKGLIVFPTNQGFQDDTVISGFKQNGGKFLLLDRHAKTGDFNYIGCDNHGGAFISARQFSNRGYRNVAYCAIAPEVSAVSERISGFEKGAELYQLNIVNKMFKISKDKNQQMDQYHPQVFLHNADLLKEQAPVGICVENDDIALGLQEHLEAAGLKIGVDFGLIGFDNTLRGKLHTPSLTSVSQNGLFMGDTAAEMIIDSIENDSITTKMRLIPTQLLVRQSCKIIEGKT